MSDDGWIPLPDVSRGPARSLPPPPAPPLDLAPLASPVATPPEAPKRSRRGVAVALAIVILVAAIAAAGVIVATRQGDDDDSGDSGGEEVAVDDGPVGPEYLEETNLALDEFSFPLEAGSNDVFAPCSDLGALDGLPAVSSGSGGVTDGFGFSAVAGAFATAEEAQEFRSAIASLEPCEYWHPDALEQVSSIEDDGDWVEVLYDITLTDGTSWPGIDTYIVSDNVVGVVACAIWSEEAWTKCDEVVDVFAGRVYDVAAATGG